MTCIRRFLPCLTGILLLLPAFTFAQRLAGRSEAQMKMHHEVPDQPWSAPKEIRTSPAMNFAGPGTFTSQVNVDATGNNILGDAANEPSIAVNPLNPQQIVIGWRQFDDVNNSFRQAGYGYSTDGGQHWTFPGVIQPGIFRSDPVLDFNAAGQFFYNSLSTYTGDYTCDVFKSTDGGATWDDGVQAKGGDKQWMTIDVTDGPGKDNIYACWNASYSMCTPGNFTRSANGGGSFEDCITVEGFPYWGTMAVGPSGELYIGSAGSFEGAMVVKSTNAQVPGSSILWKYVTQVELDGVIVGSDPINPVGLMGQVNVDADRSNGPGRGNVYVVASVARLSVWDPADVMFARSTDGGATFEAPVRLNTDPVGNYQWFGTMSVAPNGRIDVIWLDTRNAEGTYLSELYYCYSEDQGETWSINKKLSESFDPTVGYPQQAKMGDYFDMVSDNDGAHLAWANTFTGGQDVYYTHIEPTIVGLAEEKGEEEPLTVLCHPNPFRSSGHISFALDRPARVSAELLTPQGTLVKALARGEMKAGHHRIAIPGEGLAPGIYLCRVTAGNRGKTVKVVKVE